VSIKDHSPPLRNKSIWGRVVAVLIAGLSLYIVLPALTHVVSAWPRLSSLSPSWLIVMFVAELASFACSMALLRLVVHGGGWFAVVTAGLAGNAVTNVLPGGDAAGASVQFRMLAATGVDPDQAAGGLATASVLGLAGLFFLPVFALPAIFGGLVVSAGLEHAAELGLGGFVLIVAFGAIALTSDATLLVMGRSLEWMLNKIPRRRRLTTDLARRLVAQRDVVRVDLGRNWWRAVLLIAGRTGLDYLSLLSALRATGARPNPALVLLAYAATAVIALVPLTPGGLGIVEASLSGLLVLAAVPTSSSVVATLAYRLGSYWLPIFAGGACYILFRRRYGPIRSDASRQVDRREP
jgi:uncharacterized protein (TIRG00374 family)